MMLIRGSWAIKTLMAACGVGALGLLPLYAQTPDAASTFEADNAAKMSAFVRDEVEAYFKTLGAPAPLSIQTETSTIVREVEGQVATREIDIHVTLTTDQPSQVVREARQKVARSLLEQGYRLETLEGVVDPRPLANLKMETVDPPPSLFRSNGAREYAMFAAIVLALGASLTLLGALLIAPFRRKRTKLRSYHGRREPVASEGESLMDPALFSTVDESLASGGSPSRGADPVIGLEADTETEALRQLPFEKVLDRLIAAEPEDRRAIIQRLDLSPPLRRRLEQELLS